MGYTVRRKHKEPIMKTTLHLLVLGTALSAVASGEGLAPYMTIVETVSLFSLSCFGVGIMPPP